MNDICLLHWNEAEAAERLERLRAAGFDAYHSTLAGPPLLHQLRENPPSAIVIDLTRLPSHGREVGAALRAAKATRFIPLVFVDGEAEKVARVRTLLPDAVYTSWDEIGPALQTALAQPLVQPGCSSFFDGRLRRAGLTQKAGDQIRDEDRPGGCATGFYPAARSNP